MSRSPVVTRFTNFSRSRFRIAAVLAAAAIFVPALVAITPSEAGAAGTLPKSLQKFANCPIDNPAVTVCLYSKVTNTTFEIGSTTVQTTAPTIVSLGLAFNAEGDPEAVLPDNGTQAVTSSPTDLPGGLLGIPGAPDGGPLAVTVTPQLVGVPQVSISALFSRQGAAFTMPIDILVGNSSGLLGSDCTIGSPTDPATLNLTTGLTDPPSPNTAIKGKRGKVTGFHDGEIAIAGIKLVDNSFAVPGASNCGTDGILDEILDVDKSLPSAAGNNTAILQGNSYTAPAALISSYLG
jgi:hypothetical protein